MIYKQILCIYSEGKELRNGDIIGEKPDVLELKECVELYNNHRYISFRLKTWKGNVATISERDAHRKVQNIIDEELIDKSDIIIALIGRNINKEKYLWEEIGRVLDLVDKNKKPIFRIYFKECNLMSTNEEDIEDFKNLLEFHNFLNSRNVPIEFKYKYEGIEMIFNDIKNCSEIFFKDEIKIESMKNITASEVKSIVSRDENNEK